MPEELNIVVQKRDDDLISSLARGRKYQRLIFSIGKLKFEEQLLLKNVDPAMKRRLPNVLSMARKRFKNRKIEYRTVGADMLIYLTRG